MGGLKSVWLPSGTNDNSLSPFEWPRAAIRAVRVCERRSHQVSPPPIDGLINWRRHLSAAKQVIGRDTFALPDLLCRRRREKLRPPGRRPAGRPKSGKLNRPTDKPAALMVCRPAEVEMEMEMDPAQSLAASQRPALRFWLWFVVVVVVVAPGRHCGLARESSLLCLALLCFASPRLALWPSLAEPIWV